MGSQHRSRPYRLGAILLSGWLAGCSYIPWFGSEKDPAPPTKLTDIQQEVGINEIWSDRPTRGSSGRRLYLVPALASGKLYAADARGRVTAVAADSGKTLWSRDTKLSYSGGPDVAGDRLALGTSQGDLVALATTDGHELWRAKLGSEVLSEPRFTGDGKLIVHTLDDSIYGLEAQTGKELWHVNYPAPVLTLRGSSTPTITPSGILVGLSGGKLVKLDPKDGSPIWEVVVSRPSGRSELARITDIDADPVVVGNRIYVGSYNGDLAAIDEVSGDVLWRRQLSAHAGLAVDGSGLYVTDSQDNVWAANTDDGAGRWKQEHLGKRRLTAPALLDQLILVGDLEGYLHLIDKTTGRLVGRTRITKKAITARPLVSAGRVYVYAEDGTLSALSLSGAPLHKGRTPSSDKDPAAASPADMEPVPETTKSIR